MHTLTKVTSHDPEQAKAKIIEAVRHAKGNKAEAARLLELPYRALYRLITKLNLLEELAVIAAEHNFNPGHAGVIARGITPGKRKQKPKSERKRGRPRKQQVSAA